MTQLLSLGEQPHDPTGCHAGGNPHLGPCTADGAPGRQHLTGYRLTDYDHAVTTLAEIIDDRRITRQKLAKHLGIGPQTLGNGLNGKHRMDGRTLIAAYQALGYGLALIPPEEDA